MSELSPTPKPRRRTSRRIPAAGSPLFEEQGLQDEIAMLRSAIRRVDALADDGSQLPDLLRILDTLSMASSRLSSLLKAERELGEGQDLSGRVNQALAQLVVELRERQEQSKHA